MSNDVLKFESNMWIIKYICVHIFEGKTISIRIRYIESRVHFARYGPYATYIYAWMPIVNGIITSVLYSIDKKIIMVKKNWIIKQKGEYWILEWIDTSTVQTLNEWRRLKDLRKFILELIFQFLYKQHYITIITYYYSIIDSIERLLLWKITNRINGNRYSLLQMEFDQMSISQKYNKLSVIFTVAAWCNIWNLFKLPHSYHSNRNQFRTKTCSISIFKRLWLWIYRHSNKKDKG